jgi:hypothetical protein
MIASICVFVLGDPQLAGWLQIASIICLLAHAGNYLLEAYLAAGIARLGDIRQQFQPVSFIGLTVLLTVLFTVTYAGCFGQYEGQLYLSGTKLQLFSGVLGGETFRGNVTGS